MAGRLGLPSTPSPWPLEQGLPSLLRDDPLAVALTTAIDTMLGPVMATLDSLPAYVAPATAPWDWLAFLGEWVGESVQADPVSDAAPVRRRVARSVPASTLTGTAEGLRQRVSHLLDGAEVSVEDPGQTGWSATPGAPLPGTSGQVVTVRVPAGTDLAHVARIAAPYVPAHMSLEVTT